MKKVIAPLFALTLVLLGAMPAASKYLAARGERIEGSYIVVFAKGSAVETAEALALDYGADVASVWRHALNGAHFVGLTVDDAYALAEDPMIAWVEEDAHVYPNVTQGNPTWGIDRIDERDLPLSNSYTYDFTGDTVHAYVIDSGIRASHDEFGGRVSGGRDFVGDGRGTDDCMGHGTHVAGTLGGETSGVAKEVQLHPVRVFGCSGGAPTSRVIDAVEWVTENARRPAVVNMSLGGGTSSSLDEAVLNSVNQRIYYAVAAGNSNADACGFSPARSPAAHTVAASDRTDARAGFSNYGPCVDLFAPGNSITSAWIGSDSATAITSGTSMATPHVAGVAALIFDEDPGISIVQLKTQIEQMATVGRLSGAIGGSPNLLLYSLTSEPGAPARPSSLKVQSLLCYGAHDVDWSSVSGASVSGATRYELYESTSPFYTWQTRVYNGSGTSYFANVGTTSYFRVRACNSNGCSSYREGDRAAQYINGCF